MNHLSSEDEMRHSGFELPVDERERGQVERGMREHRDPDPSRDREDGSEGESGDRGLLDAGEPLVRVVEQRKQRGGEEHDPRPGAYARSEQLAESLEQESPEYDLFSETAAGDQEINGSGERGRIAGQV